MSNSIVRISVIALVSTAFGCASVAPSAPTDPSTAPSTTRYSANLLLARPPVAPQAAGDDAAAPAGGVDTEALAKKLANPIAALISVPLQLNYDDDLGPGDGTRWRLNVQPVIPISLSADWNLISRTIVPFVAQQDIPAGNDETGLGDITQSLFFSPVAPTESGWITGVGPVLLIPTASDETLGGEQWGIGPTGVALKQDGPVTYGALANHIWSFAGDDDRADVNATFVQPFISYTTPEAYTFGLNAESTYDWKGDDLTLPINGFVSKVLKIGGQLVSVGGGVRYWAVDSDGSPEGFGFRFFVTLLYPK